MIDFLFILIASSLAGSVMILAVKVVDFFWKKHGVRLQYLLMRMMLFMYLISTVAIAVTSYKSRVLYIQKGEIADFPYVEHVTGWGFKEVFGTDSYKIFGTILLIWFIGFWIMEIEDIVREKMMLRKILKESRKYDSDDFNEQKEIILQQMKIKKEVNVFQSLVIDTPFTTGIFKPTVVLPEYDFSSEVLDIILRHEFTHLKRRETFYKFLMGFIRGINWFNPLMIMFTREFFNYSEMSCDELVMENEGKEVRFQYSKLLLAIAGGEFDNEVIAALASSNEKIMERRIINIMSGNRKVNRMMTAMVSLLFLWGCLGVISVSANSTSALKEWIVEEKRSQNGIEEQTGVFLFPEGENQFVTPPSLGEDENGAKLSFANREENQIEVEVERENFFELEDASVGRLVRFNVFSPSVVDRFHVGVLNLNTGEYWYAASNNGGSTHTFEITKPGKYVAFIKNDHWKSRAIQLFGDIYVK